MFSRWAVCAFALVAGCVAPADPPFHDKGRGVWAPMPGAPVMPYLAVWGADARDVLVVGDGGIARFDGDTWHLAEGVPATVYRAVWGRSSSEAWIGGDNVMLARSFGGWQAQQLYDGQHEITSYSVLALGGSALHEYAIVRTGGKRLLLVNQGSAWETPYWRDGNGPTWPLPAQPSLLVHGPQLLVAGEGGLVECKTSDDLGIATWEAYRWRAGQDLPPVSSISGGADFWVAASGSQIVVQRDEEADVTIIDEATTPAHHDALAVFASGPNRIFVVGDPRSPVEACDDSGCVPERVDGVGDAALRAVWGDPDGTVISVGDGVIVERATCGTLRCSRP